MPRRPVILVDADIPFVNPVLGRIADLIPVPGHRIDSGTLEGADGLVVRSVTRVDRGLLGASDVRFVGSATSGVDHVDTAWLASRGIAFADAAGANADSVVEYVLSALAAASGAVARRIDRLTLGVVGCGRIGERLARRAEHLGLDVLRNDPPRQRRESGERTAPDFVSLDELLRASDIVSVHVPLVTGGRYPTVRLIGRDQLSIMRESSWLIQTSRGGTVDERAIVAARSGTRLGYLVLDVWEDEPDPDPNAIDVADIATPHIAGYSRDAKLAGIRRIRDAMVRHFELEEPVPRIDPGVGTPQSAASGGTPERSLSAGPPESAEPSADLPEGRPEQLPAPSAFRLEALTSAFAGATELLRALVPQMYDVRSDDRTFRRAMGDGRDLSGGRRADRFHRLRADYPPRWSFSRYTVRIPGAGEASKIPKSMLTEGLGVSVDRSP